MIIDYTWERLETVQDILKRKRPYGKRVYNKLIKVWAGRKIKSLERSKDVSALKAEELTLLNYLFGSNSTCHVINDKETQKSLLKLIPYDLFRNFRRSTGNRSIGVTVENWLWTEKKIDFLDELDNELICLENILVSYMVFMLGGFTAPRDNLKSKLNDWITVDVSSLFNQPRDLFLLSNLSPAILLRFLYWKTTSVLMGLMRLYSSNVSLHDVKQVKKQLINKKYIN